MKKRRHRKSKLYKKQHPITNMALIPIFLIIALLPLIIYGKMVEIDGLEALYWKGGSIHFDFFHYYKAIYFVVFSTIGLLLLIILQQLDRIDFIKTTYYIPLLIYVLSVLLSFVFSQDKEIAFRGFIEMYQGLFVLLSYVIVVITTLNLVTSKKHVMFLIYGFLFVGIAMGIIGVGQYFGYDIFRSNFGQLLILPKNLEPLANELQFKFADFAIYGTLFNTNFVGSFAALLIPLSFAYYFYQKSILKAFLSLLFVGLMVFIGFGSNSRAGMVGVIAALLLITLVFRRELLNKPLYVLVPFISIVIIGLGLNVASDGRIVNEIKNLSLAKDIERAEELLQSKVFIEKIEFNDYHGSIVTTDESIQFDFINNELYFFTDNDVPLETVQNGHTVTFIDSAYDQFSFTRSEDLKYYTVRLYGRQFNMWMTIEGFKFEGIGGNLFIPENPYKIQFLDQYGSLFSGRTSIWATTIPMMKDNVFVGAGPDMFIIAYPQNDLAGRLNYFGLSSIVEKPHNMYLQTAINTGIISLLAFLTFVGMYLVESLKLYFMRNIDTFNEYIGAGIMASIAAYLVSGVFNDQILSVAPLFYVLIGLGIAVNRLIKNDMKSSKNIVNS